MPLKVVRVSAPTTALFCIGSERNGWLPEQGVLPALDFRYRVPSPVAVFELKQPKASGKQAWEATVQFVVDHLVSWDASQPAGLESVKRLPYVVLQQLAIVIGG